MQNAVTSKVHVQWFNRFIYTVRMCRNVFCSINILNMENYVYEFIFKLKNLEANYPFNVT